MVGGFFFVSSINWELGTRIRPPIRRPVRFTTQKPDFRDRYKSAFPRKKVTKRH